MLAASGGGGAFGTSMEEVEKDGAGALGALLVILRQHDVHEAPRASGNHHRRRRLGTHWRTQTQIGLRRKTRAGRWGRKEAMRGGFVGHSTQHQRKVQLLSLPAAAHPRLLDRLPESTKPRLVDHKLTTCTLYQ